MDKNTLTYVIEKTHELMNAPTCCEELKVAAQTWLEAVGTECEGAETKRYIDELEADLVTIDNLIGFASSEAGVQYFGKELASNIVAHGKEIKAAGAKYCDCPACLAVQAILEKKASMIDSI